MSKPVNYRIGEKFGRLTIVAAAGWRGTGRNRYARVACVCDCGGTTQPTLQSVVNNRTKSCGCLHREMMREREKHAHARRDSKRPREYNSWAQMRSRCNDPGANGYRHYGGRGIRVCEEWSDFRRFLADMGPCEMGRSLDRINVDGNYEPTNCRWATRKEQAANTRRRRELEHMGFRLSVKEWADKLGVPVGRISSRLRRGWPVEKALS